MNTEQLKALNKPENLLEEYNVKIPFYGIPPEVLQNLIFMLTEIAKYQAPMQERINELPTWAAWENSIRQDIKDSMSGHATAVSKFQKSLEREFQNQMKALKRGLAETLDGRLNRWEKKLQIRDTTPSKLRWKWIGIGAAILPVSWGLWHLLKLFS